MSKGLQYSFLLFLLFLFDVLMANKPPLCKTPPSLPTYSVFIEVLDGEAFLQLEKNDKGPDYGFLPFSLFDKRPILLTVNTWLFSDYPGSLLAYEPLLAMSLKKKEEQGYQLAEGVDIALEKHHSLQNPSFKNCGIEKIVYVVYPKPGFHRKKVGETCTLYLVYYEKGFTLYLKSSHPKKLACFLNPSSRVITMHLYPDGK